MSTYPAPRKSLTVFNPYDYQVKYDEDTIDYGDGRYLVKSKGGSVTGSTTFNTLTASTLSTGSNLVVKNTSSSTVIRLGPASSFSTAQAKFGTTSVFLPRVSSNGLTIENINVTSPGITSLWCLEFWYFPLSFTSTNQVIMSTRFKTSNYVALLVNSSGQVILDINTGGTTLQQLISTNSMTLNTWHHICFGHNVNRYNLFLEGVMTQSGANTNQTSWITVDSLLHFGGWYADGSQPCHGYVDEIRFSSVARYASPFTPRTTAFTSADVSSATRLQYHCESLVSHDVPTTTSAQTSISDTGDATVIEDLTVSNGSITSQGNILTSGGYIGTYRDVITGAHNWRIGASSLLGSTVALSSTTTAGCYTVCGAWTTVDASSHTIHADSFLLHPSNTGIVGNFTIYITDKANSGTTRLGVIRGDYLLIGGTASFFTISTTKTSGLSTFSAAVSGSNLVITTDSSCRMCWRADLCV